MIARLGGDEFVVVPAHRRCQSDIAEELADRLQSAAARARRRRRRNAHPNRQHRCGTRRPRPRHHLGPAPPRRPGGADRQERRAATRSRCSPTRCRCEADYRNDIELHLQNVIENGALFLHYLPEVDMRTGEILATEALVRWDHPDPGLAIPCRVHRRRRVDQPGRRTRALGYAHGVRGVRAVACPWRRPTASCCASTSHRFSWSPTASSTSVADVMREFDLDRGSVCLEITESVVVQDIETTSITLAGLKEVGVQVAIDDFGTGYSVLSHLKSLPVDVLKIDRGFVADLGSNPDDLAIVRAIIALAEAFEPAAGRRGSRNRNRRAHAAAPRVLPRAGLPVVAARRRRGNGGPTGQGPDSRRPFRSATFVVGCAPCACPHVIGG